MKIKQNRNFLEFSSKVWEYLASLSSFFWEMNGGKFAIFASALVLFDPITIIIPHKITVTCFPKWISSFLASCLSINTLKFVKKACNSSEKCLHGVLVGFA